MDGVLTRPHRLFALFLAWWCGELAALVPRRARRLFRRGARILVLEPSREEVVLRLLRGERCRELGRVDLEGEDGAAQAAAIRALTRRVNLNKTEIALRLPAAQALRRTLDLPRSAEPDLRQALFFQIDQQTPFTPQEVYFDYRVTGRQPEAKRLTVEMTVVPRTVVGDALAMAARWGLSPAIVDVAGDDAGAPSSQPPLGGGGCNRGEGPLAAQRGAGGRGRRLGRGGGFHSARSKTNDGRDLARQGGRGEVGRQPSDPAAPRGRPAAKGEPLSCRGEAKDFVRY